MKGIHGYILFQENSHSVLDIVIVKVWYILFKENNHLVQDIVIVKIVMHLIQDHWYILFPTTRIQSTFLRIVLLNGYC